MILNKVKIKNYRNYKDTEINFNDGINIIVGANNSGKTNILHIISLLSRVINFLFHLYNIYFHICSIKVVSSQTFHRDVLTSH